MILIISVDYDQTTSEVLEWLFHFKKKFILINGFWSRLRQVVSPIGYCTRIRNIANFHLVDSLLRDFIEFVLETILNRPDNEILICSKNFPNHIFQISSINRSENIIS